MRVSPDFVSVGVNRVVNALDWGDNGLIAYCGHSIVCIYNPQVRLK
jgi:elongator complex protein 2